MTHKFDVNNRNKLDSPKRRQMLPVNKVVTEIGLKETDQVADIGCGIGYFSIPFATVTKSSGLVYALDVEAQMLEVIDQKIAEESLSNIRTVLTEEYDFKLEEESVSYAFMCTVLHEVVDKNRFINEGKRILTEGGKLAIVEWVKCESDWGPSIGHRLDSLDAQQILLDCGFKDISKVKLNEHFYILKATK
ncbi:class I SAM-dependent methyltransferase [Aminipila sp.]|uniref:class I SAM-dependent methyltransferase n=1 Tax=Aminipila sp. TaxID=2060095 RepID=UPI00289B41D8|nr:class I SAM-dependent methyltransferase [Aminipila sp.]